MFRISFVLLALASALALNGCSQCSQQQAEEAAPTEAATPVEAVPADPAAAPMEGAPADGAAAPADGAAPADAAATPAGH